MYVGFPRQVCARKDPLILVSGKLLCTLHCEVHISWQVCGWGSGPRSTTSSICLQDCSIPSPAQQPGRASERLSSSCHLYT